MATPEHDVDDQSLARRLRHGDAAALALFTETYLDRLYRFVYLRVAGDQQAAEDITQESLLAALRGLERFDSRAGLYTWLCSIARHKIADHFRRLQRLEHVQAQLAEAPERALSPADLAERAEQRRRVLTTLRAVRPQYQQVLLLKYLDRLSDRQLGAQLRLSEAAVESLLARARKAFRETYRAEERSDSPGSRTR